MVERKLIKFYKNEATRMIAKCEWTTCAWRCMLSTNSRTSSWQISSFIQEHTCPPRRDNRLVTAKRVAEKYEKFILANPSWSLERMRQTIQEEMFADVSIPKLKRAKSIVLQKALDSTKGQYKHLYSYQEELLRSNPGSTVVIKRDTEGVDHVFQRMYICLDACKRGFKAGCRKVVGLDGCFFKGATNGELLCAIGRDANNQMYPIAWAVVEKENNDSWDWFRDLLSRDIDVEDGLDRVIRRRNGEALRYRAKAPCMTLFNLAKAGLAKRTPQGAQGIMQTDPSLWSGAWFRLGSNCDSVDNNMCESFNKWIVEARFYPIITMLEAIRRKVMVRIQQNRTKAESWNTLICPNILKKVNSYITLSSSCHAICNGQHQFEVQHFANRFTVDLSKKQCSCRYWQLSGLPCPHAISCIFYKTNSLAQYIAPCHSVAEFKKTYTYCLQPLEGMTSWPVSNRPPLKAPGYVRMPGRPKKERIREPTEKPKSTRQISRVGTVIRCRKCKQIGHNRSTCDKRNGPAPNTANSGAAPSAPTHHSQAAPKAPSHHEPVHAPAHTDIVQSNTQESTTTSKKRKAAQMSTKKMLCSSAKASVHTTVRGQAQLNLNANAPLSQASSSVSINLTGGNAEGSVSAQAPVKRAKLPPRRRATQQQ
ncbi:hypothetical protein U9M48_002459, partial [Paspalum notatum var. saurae]